MVLLHADDSREHPQSKRIPDQGMVAPSPLYINGGRWDTANLAAERAVEYV